MTKELSHYALLAPIYDQLGMFSFAENITPKLILYAQSNDWLGRRIIDLGCGTGASVRWLANKGYNITGIDMSAEMLAVARATVPSSGLGVSWRAADIRVLGDMEMTDMALALDVMNELGGLRDLEMVFAVAHKLLSPGKLLVFDLHTIEGLMRRLELGGHYLYDSSSLVVFATEQYDYERQIQTTRHDIFRQLDGGWTRGRAALIRRGYPVQAVAALLQRMGFSVMALLNPQLEPVDPSSVHSDRVIFFARKGSSE
jgi:predicted TPR repeat methyltransferase